MATSVWQQQKSKGKSKGGKQARKQPQKIRQNPAPASGKGRAINATPSGPLRGIVSSEFGHSVITAAATPGLEYVGLSATTICTPAQYSSHSSLVGHPDCTHTQHQVRRLRCRHTVHRLRSSQLQLGLAAADAAGVGAPPLESKTAFGDPVNQKNRCISPTLPKAAQLKPHAF